jgi:hypothetical protein
MELIHNPGDSHGHAVYILKKIAAALVAADAQ